VQKDDVEES
jgi:hypothetical protein